MSKTPKNRVFSGLKHKATMIEGVIIQPLKQIPDERGKVMHMLRVDSPLFSKFGEIYFSVVNPGVVKAWKRHKLMTLHYAVPIGNIKVVIYDDRKNSKTRGEVQEVFMGEDNYCLLVIPPMLWSGFMGMSPYPSLIANYTDLPHDPSEVERSEAFDKTIPYDWSVRPT